MSSPATELLPSPSIQLTLELPAPPASAETPLVPVRMLNEWVYCPRLAFLEWVDGEWADSGDTEEGRRANERSPRELVRPAREGLGRNQHSAASTLRPHCSAP